MTTADVLIAAAPLVFVGLTVIACGTAALLGGADGRWTALLYTLALVATRVADHYDRLWASPNVPVAAIDTLLFVGFYVIALRSRRYWPLWLAGLQLLTVTAHVSAWLAPAYFYRAYFVLAVVWSLPKMGLLLIGVLADWRRDHERLADSTA